MKTTPAALLLVGLSACGSPIDDPTGQREAALTARIGEAPSSPACREISPPRGRRLHLEAIPNSDRVLVYVDGQPACEDSLYALALLGFEDARITPRTLNAASDPMPADTDPQAGGPVSPPSPGGPPAQGGDANSDPMPASGR